MYRHNRQKYDFFQKRIDYCMNLRYIVNASYYVNYRFFLFLPDDMQAGRIWQIIE